jgi:hypothetical protein
MSRLTRLRLYFADLSIATLERQLQQAEQDYLTKCSERSHLYSRYTFESRQPRSGYGRDAVVLIGVVLMGLAGIFLRGL